MIDLTPRQIQILRAIIEEFIETAEPVGSDTIDRKYQIGVSPATIRNEMVDLTNKKYLYKPHSSAGRSPTPKAMKLYVNELMRERELSVADEVSAKEKVWEARDQFEPLLQAVTKVLAHKTKTLSIAVANNKNVYHAGYANLLQMPEFYDIETMRHVLTLIEEVKQLQEIFEFGASENPIHIVFGQELGNRHLGQIGVIYTQITLGNRTAQVGLIGSPRFEYDYVIPFMKYCRGLILEMVH